MIAGPGSESFQASSLRMFVGFQAQGWHCLVILYILSSSLFKSYYCNTDLLGAILAHSYSVIYYPSLSNFMEVT